MAKAISKSPNNPPKQKVIPKSFCEDQFTQRIERIRGSIGTPDSAKEEKLARELERIIDSLEQDVRQILNGIPKDGYKTQVEKKDDCRALRRAVTNAKK